MPVEQPQEGMESENPTPEVKEEENSNNAFGLPDDHPAVKEIARVRREAAANRVKKVEVEEAAKKWEEYVDSQKTEMERLADRNKALEELVATRSREDKQRALAKEYGIPESMAHRIRGSNDEEMEADAKEFGASLPSKEETQTPSSNDLRGGPRGEPVVPSQKSDGGNFLLDLFDNSAT